MAADERSASDPDDDGAASPSTTRRQAADPSRRLPDRLTHLRWPAWRRAGVEALRAFQRDNCSDLAAALTYWTILAMFPAIIVVVALVRLVATGPEAVDAIMGVIGELAPDAATGELEPRIRELVGQRSGAGLLLSFGLLGALWSASAYLRAFTRAANMIYGVREGRPFYLLVPTQLVLTVLAMLSAA